MVITAFLDHITIKLKGKERLSINGHVILYDVSRQRTNKVKRTRTYLATMQNAFPIMYLNVSLQIRLPLKLPTANITNKPFATSITTRRLLKDVMSNVSLWLSVLYSA